MSNWTPSDTQPGYVCKIIQRGPATITILRPILDDRERAKREKQAQDSLSHTMSQYMRRKGA